MVDPSTGDSLLNQPCDLYIPLETRGLCSSHKLYGATGRLSLLRGWWCWYRFVEAQINEKSPAVQFSENLHRVNFMR